jgi:DNA-binding response OmpR family regulator
MATQTQPLRFLIVEDHGLIAAQLHFIIKNAGHTVVALAENSGSACELALKHKPDIVLLDVALGDGQLGVDVAQFLINSCQCEVVFTTANRRRIPEHYCGAVGVIEKPFTRMGLVSAIDFIVARIKNIALPALKPESLKLSPSYAVRWAT